MTDRRGIAPSEVGRRHIGKCIPCDKSKGAQYYQKTKVSRRDIRLGFEHKYRENNKGKDAQKSAKRRALMLCDLTSKEKEQVDIIYETAQWCSLVVGEAVHVDHIIPISKGGLHHPDNLQILTALDNMAKSDQM